MRQAGTLEDEAQARQFCDVLLARGISSRVDRDNGGWTVWVHEEQDVDSSKKLLRQFLEQPAAPEYQDAEKVARDIRRDHDRQLKRFRENQVDVRRRWQPHRGPAPLTWLLIGTCLVAAIATQWGTPRGQSRWDVRAEQTMNLLRITSVERQGAMIRYYRLREVRSGQLWRLVTPIFLHFGLLHLLFNMYWLYDFGTAIESRRGSWRLLAMVLPVAVISNLAEYYWSGPMFGGMSGVVFGLFGYMWMQSRYVPASGLFVPQGLVYLLVGFLLVGMTGALRVIFGIHVANAAHAGGLLVGMAIGYAPVLWRKLRR